MPRIKVKESGKDCSICLEEFKVDEEARETPCKHVFHSGCVEKWLRIHGSCPVCRFFMPAEEEESGGDRSGGDRGQESLEGGEIGSGFVRSVLAFASFMAMAGLHVGSDQVDEDDCSAQDMDGN
ncbi:RING/U-box superfamily protein [Theobroma cacao]|uniref:RING/U-box superfamily protein n=1 Tax=Theobroma cacao TaxID=3641 RepID=A0A061EEQ8_THECC|nr:RING/U-box superfamily protein [Theobroma cacao]